MYFDISCTEGRASYLRLMDGFFSEARSGYGSRSAESRRLGLQRIDKLAQLFDTAFILPGTKFRFGIEAVMRLVPVVGDAAASALSCYLLYEAHRLEVPKHVFARLVANVAIEGAAGTIPLIGDLFDVGFRANRRNVKILKEYFVRQGLL